MSSEASVFVRKGPHNLAYWLNAWIPVGLGVVVIWFESTEMLGSDHTSQPLRWLFEHIFHHVSDARWDVVHHVIRKTGHFVGYGLISLAWLRAWHRTLPRLRFISDALLALFGTVVLASWDEWHQSFLPNRTAAPSDVLLDFCGAICMVLLARIIAARHFRPAE